MLTMRTYANSVQEALRPDDPRLGGTVRLLHRDGTRMRLEFAFLQQQGDWLCVFTRGHGCFVYHKDKLAEYDEQHAAAPEPPRPVTPSAPRPPKVGDVVHLTEDVPHLSLHEGDVAVVRSTWFAPRVAYEVEFHPPGADAGAEGRALLEPQQVRLAADAEAAQAQGQAPAAG